ncbi:NnrU family protein [Oryzibacter oryziterrae]|uniref:NnrU family protein n=1 Tax=Oryzibacter oryziterrae TaxID=2766474 RepID=UPI001F2F9E70|nr:NnrU family protein [Oryzibacter oryziterrae]
MVFLVLGLVLFIGTHSISIIAPQLRERAIARLGANQWRGLYSLLSLSGLVLLIWGYGVARETPVIVWDPPLFTRHITLTLMLFVFPLLFAAYMPGRIKKAAKHPMLLAVKIWAFSHLLANGTLADMVLFGALLAWAVVARIAAKKRPLTVDVDLKARPLNDLLAVGLGLAVYLVMLFYLHEVLIGVSPLAL